MTQRPVFDFAAFPTLTTERLLLRELAPADAPDVLVFRSDPEGQKYNSAPMREVGEALALITELRKAYAAGQQLYWAITVPPAQGVIGICGFNSWQRYHRRAAIGYDLARSYWGQGIGTSGRFKGSRQPYALRRPFRERPPPRLSQRRRGAGTRSGGGR